MKKVIGVRFRTAGKVYYFDPTGKEIYGEEYEGLDPEQLSQLLSDPEA